MTALGEVTFANVYNERSKHGFLSYAAQPNKSIPVLEHLIENAVDNVPPSRKPSTYLMLRATGLEILDHKQATDFLHTIRKYFLTTGLRVDSESVTEVHKKEKIYPWITVNLLLGRLLNKTMSTVAIADLGLSAAHQAFAVEVKDVLKPWQKEHLFNITAINRTFEVFSYTGYGLGVDGARIRILEEGQLNTTYKFKSECIHPKLGASWSLERKQYVIEASDGNVNIQAIDFRACRKVVKAVVKKQKKKGASMNGKTVYATSYYHSALVQSKYVEPQDVITMSVKNIKSTAKKTCALSTFSHPFVCMDLVYIYMLLRKYYGMDKDSDVTFVKRLDGQKVSWTLGAAFDKFSRDVNGKTKVAI